MNQRPPSAAGRLGAFGAVVLASGILFGMLALPAAVALTTVVDAVEEQVFDVPDLPVAEVPPENSFIYAANGDELAEINYEESRLTVSLDEIPEVTRNAVIATEDGTFWEHNGINRQAIARAFLSNLQAGGIDSGASTITQQLVKLAYIGIENAEVTYDRKIREALWAIELEKRLPKEEILERYLNRAYFGNGVYGVAKAAERYYGVDVGDLNLQMSATLAGTIRSPENNNPLDDRRSARNRRDIVLDQMAAEGYISDAVARRTKRRSLQLDPQPPQRPVEPFWVDYITRLLTDEQVAKTLGTHVDALEAMGTTSDERISAVFQGGLRIYTTIDVRLQNLAEESIRQTLTYEGEGPAEIAQEPFGAIVSVQPGTGRVRAMATGPRNYGSCTETEEPQYVGVGSDGRLLCDKTQLNPIVPGAGGSGRQPGSAFKPFVITTALERGLPPGWEINANGPAEIPNCDNGGPWTVNNSGGDGIRNMYTGVAASSNVYHAKLVREIGPENVKEVARRLGIRNGAISEECSIALGSADVFPLEMATAYAALANRGAYCPPAFITRIEDRDGNLIYRHRPRCKQAVSTEIADRVVDIMQGPVSPGGTAPGANLGAWPTRGKTGTTQDYRDAWFVGYVRQLATAAWVGYPNGLVTYEDEQRARAACGGQYEDAERSGTPRDGAWCLEVKYLANTRIAGNYYSRVFGGTLPAPMWTRYMQQAVERYEPEGWPDPGPMPTATVPNLLGTSSLSSAEALANSARFNFQATTVAHWRPRGTYLSQSPSPGSVVPAGSLLQVSISDGSLPVPNVPGVVGLTVDQARSRLRGAGYREFVTYQSTSNRGQDGRVVSQSPGAGAFLDPTGSNDVVRIVVARFEGGGGGGGGGGDDGGGGGNGGGGNGGGGNNGGGGGG